ncbi:MAG TPA: YncE family protein [Polyangiaceae bacterium]|jgi:DNA-binding beta-propeller fold protein YncE|nr:YncE family protein [Polyangiaceae bacterium]
MGALRRISLCLGFLGAGWVAPSAGAAAPPPPLAEVQVIALPGVERRIDHLAVDPAGKRLFVAALGNGTLEALDLAAGKRITSITGLKEPQGIAYLPLSHRIVVAMRGGAVASFDDAKYERTATLPNLGDADNLRYDAAAGQLYLGYGEGALGVIDPASLKLVASIPVGGHPESFRLEESGPLIFVNVPPKREILVVDRLKRAIVKHIALGGASDNYPMSLDESGHRLFVGVRQPPELLVFDSTSGQRIATVPCVADTDDLFYDARRKRVYVIGGQGYVDVFDAGASGKYERLARIATRVGARTGLWSNELDRLFVAWPARDGHPAEIHALAAPGG